MHNSYRNARCARSVPDGLCASKMVHQLPLNNVDWGPPQKNFRERTMVDFERCATPTRIQHITKRKLRQLGMATALASGLLASVTDTQARITQIQITSAPNTIAFGGYSFPGVGQYEVITGIATGEVNPNSLQNSVITDIKLAPVNANGNVVYQHNFYILKPVNLKQGNHKMMYEPPNRGGKTYQTLNNTPTGTNDPAALTDPNVLANSFLWTRGYTTVWSGWENNLAALGGGPLAGGPVPPTGPVSTASFPIVHGQGNATITGPGYEYIVTGAATFTLAYPAASGTQGAPNAVLTHRVHLDDP